jgi:hypothetical protein
LIILKRLDATDCFRVDIIKGLLLAAIVFYYKYLVGED